jgi:Bacterial protein of unknown function (DUF899)
MTAGMHLPEVVSPEDWLAARKDLLVKEKEATRARDRVNADRRRLRWCASTSQSSELTARTWSPVSRFTGHARSRHTSQALRRGFTRYTAHPPLLFTQPLEVEFLELRLSRFLRT